MNPIQEGLWLMALGMGVVFSFLVLMVIVMNASGAVIGKISKYFPTEEVKTENVSMNQNKARIAAIIAIASAQANS